MSIRTRRTYFEDILDATEAIRNHLAGIGFAAYESDRKTRHAVERELQILTEAVFRLGPELAILCPSVDWRQLRGMGNFLRHEYDDVDDQIVWDLIHDTLPLVYAAVSEALTSLSK